ncbi:MAG: iron ABC transporter permease [Candidatus Auribacterota bacterium]|jgi:iron complex transport system permease protein|uniref:Iron ABC transporter permease n=1 Tax=Candidatus Auribacter fodinae TaxID=2093366 RepID=A0A3A4R4Y5_9BACT|nr:MAG: iron ABC transporter permease [Candidatus Auribacter fodinae]
MMHRKQTLRDIILLILPFIYVAVLIYLPLIGPVRYPLSLYTTDADQSIAAHILWRIRLPRCVMAYCGGALLAVGGMVFQSLFRNPLATPFTLGVSSGCSLGAALSIAALPYFSLFGFDSTTLCAFGGGMLATGVVYLLTSLRRDFHSTYMLLAGIAVTLFFSSMVLLIQYTAHFHSTFHIFRWLIGGIETVSVTAMVRIIPVTLVIPLIIFLYGKELDLLLVGDEIAVSKGIDIRTVKFMLFLLVSIMVSCIVAICGPIAFVGMIIPHMCRLIFGPRHRKLTVLSFLWGGLFLLLCDTIARTVTAPTELPVGLITAFLGGPFFLWILIQYGKTYHL